MRTITVKDQAELDAAIKEHGQDWHVTILIDSPEGVWLEIGAFGSATVRAFGSATVEASGSATVRASDSATVEAGKFVAVHLHSAKATITGGVVIDITELDLTDPATWADYTGAQVEDGRVVLYKAVDENLTAGHHYTPVTYTPGEDVTAEDWRDNNECGGGLHVSPHPHQARWYAGDAKRMLRVTVPIGDVRPIPGSVAKCKAETVRVEAEVALYGGPLAGDPR